MAVGGRRVETRRPRPRRDGRLGRRRGACPGRRHRPDGRAKPLLDGAARRTTSDRVTAELLGVIDLPVAERQAVAATRARARARGAGPLGGITSRIYRWSGRQGRVADPGAFLGRWRERGSLASALDVLRVAVDAPLREVPPATRAMLATSVEPASLGTSLARALDRAIAARASTVPSSRIWTLIGVLQTLATLAIVFSAVWVGLWIFVRFPVDSITVPVLGQLPMPFVALVTSLLAGYLIARALGAHAGWLGRRWARVLGREVREQRRSRGRAVGVRGARSARSGPPGAVECGSRRGRGLRAAPALSTGPSPG